MNYFPPGEDIHTVVPALIEQLAKEAQLQVDWTVSGRAWNYYAIWPPTNKEKQLGLWLGRQEVSKYDASYSFIGMPNILHLASFRTAQILLEGVYFQLEVTSSLNATMDSVLGKDEAVPVHIKVSADFSSPLLYFVDKVSCLKLFFKGVTFFITDKLWCNYPFCGKLQETRSPWRKHTKKRKITWKPTSKLNTGQQKAAVWMLSMEAKGKCGGILALHPGSGKTGTLLPLLVL